MWIFIAFILLCIVIVVQEISKEHKYSSGKMSDEETKRYEEFKEKQRKATTISKVMIVSANSDSRKKIGSSVIRGTVGGALLGPVGLVGGALSGKNKITNETTFLIEYKDGHRVTKTVNNNSSEFKNLCKYLEM